LQGNMVAPKVAAQEANEIFIKNPISASLSGLWPRLIGVLFKRVPKFGFLLGYSYMFGDGEPGFAAATAAFTSACPASAILDRRFSVAGLMVSNRLRDLGALKSPSMKRPCSSAMVTGVRSGAGL